MRDLSTLISMLKSKNVTFDPPANVLVGLAKLLVFFFENRVEDDSRKRLNYVATLFLISLHSKKRETNVMCCDESRRFWNKMLSLCLSNILIVKTCAQLCVSVSSESEIPLKSSQTIANRRFLTSDRAIQILRSVLFKSFESRFTSLERSRLVMDDPSSNSGLSKFLDMLILNHKKCFVSQILTIPGVANDFTSSTCFRFMSSTVLLENLRLDTLGTVRASSKYNLPIKNGGSEAYLLGNLVHMWIKCRNKQMNDTYLVAVHNLARSLPSDVFSRSGAHCVVKKGTTCRAVRLANVLTRQLKLLASEAHVKDIVNTSLSHYHPRAEMLVKQDLARQDEIISSKYKDERKKRQESRWNWLSSGSKWAKNLFASKKKKKKKKEGVLKNVSSQSRQIAQTGKGKSIIALKRRNVNEDHKIVRALCELCLLMIRRGDEINAEDENVRGHVILSFLCFSTCVVKDLWYVYSLSLSFCQSQTQKSQTRTYYQGIHCRS